MKLTHPRLVHPQHAPDLLHVQILLVVQENHLPLLLGQFHGRPCQHLRPVLPLRQRRRVLLPGRRKKIRQARLILRQTADRHERLSTRVVQRPVILLHRQTRLLRHVLMHRPLRTDAGNALIGAANPTHPTVHVRRRERPTPQIVQHRSPNPGVRIRRELRLPRRVEIPRHRHQTQHPR